MKLGLTLPLLAAISVGFSVSAIAAPVEGSKGAAKAATQASYLQGSGPLTPKQRGDITRDFVKRWGPYFQQAYNQPMDRWAIKQAKVIAAADPNNLRAAMQNQTLEAAMMTMRGQPTTDEQAVNHLAKSEPGSGTLFLGDLAKDLVYTPLAPCRIFDTRAVNGGGIVTSGGTRSYDTFPFGGNVNFAYQGGTSAGNCGVSPDAAAVALNIAAPLSVVGGFLTVFPYDTVRPLASALDYQAGELTNSEIIARSANAFYDISVYVHGQSHIVGDVVGYFIRPEATALNCVEVDASVSVPANSTATVFSGICPATFAITGGGCSNNSFSGRVVTSRTFPTQYFCAGANESANSITLVAVAKCCRVPGS